MAERRYLYFPSVTPCSLAKGPSAFLPILYSAGSITEGVGQHKVLFLVLQHILSDNSKLKINPACRLSLYSELTIVFPFPQQFPTDLLFLLIIVCLKLGWKFLKQRLGA